MNLGCLARRLGHSISSIKDCRELVTFYQITRQLSRELFFLEKLDTRINTAYSVLARNRKCPSEKM